MRRSMPGSNPYTKHLENQQPSTAGDDERNAVNRHETAVLILDAVDTADDLVLLTSMLGLDEELDELAGTSPERQRLLQAARARLELEVGTPVS